MIKVLHNYNILIDGSVFRFLRVVPESILKTGDGRMPLHNWKGLLRLMLISRKQRLLATQLYIIAHNSYRGYYHWLLESLPRILEAQQRFPKFVLLLPVDYGELFYDETLRLLGISQVVRLQSGVVYHVPQLALPYLEEAMGSYSLDVLKNLKQCLFKLIGINNAVKPSSRLYISRKKAIRRKVLNESQLEELLIAYGFQCICFEDYKFEDQVRLCSQAEILIGLHGAGLANIAFQPDQAVVIELRKNDNGVNYFFEQLALTLGHQYHLLYCKAENEQQSVQDANLWIDLPQLTAILNSVVN